MPERITKLLLNDKPIIKLTQLQKVTPLSKIRMIQPSMSANRTHTPSHVQNFLNVRLVFSQFYFFKITIFTTFTYRYLTCILILVSESINRFPFEYR